MEAPDTAAAAGPGPADVDASGHGGSPDQASATPQSGAPARGTRKRLDHIDAMRPVKQAGVVSTHTMLAFAPAASLALGASLMLLHVTREAFLFVSACMLAYSYRDLNRFAVGIYWRRRFVSVGIPYLCWTLIYFLVTLPKQSGGFWSSLGHLGFLTATGYYQLYYLIVIMQFYLVFPWMVALFRRYQHRQGTILAVSAAIQLATVTLMHWGYLPPGMRGFWATREITSYQFYLVAGMVVAFHLDQVHRWLCSHVRLIVASTVATAALAELWYFLAAKHAVGWLGPSSDPFQPIVIPFNIAAIAFIYVIGVALVGERRSARTRAAVHSGSDNAYGIYLAQMLFISGFAWLGWRQLESVVPWPLLIVATVAAVFLACVLLTSIIARTPLAKAVGGRSRVPWPDWVVRMWRQTKSAPSPLEAEAP